MRNGRSLSSMEVMRLCSPLVLRVWGGCSIFCLAIGKSLWMLGGGAVSCDNLLADKVWKYCQNCSKLIHSSN